MPQIQRVYEDELPRLWHPKPKPPPKGYTRMEDVLQIRQELAAHPEKPNTHGECRRRGNLIEGLPVTFKVSEESVAMEDSHGQTAENARQAPASIPRDSTSQAMELVRSDAALPINTVYEPRSKPHVPYGSITNKDEHFIKKNSWKVPMSDAIQPITIQVGKPWLNPVEDKPEVFEFKNVLETKPEAKHTIKPWNVLYHLKRGPGGPWREVPPPIPEPSCALKPWRTVGNKQYITAAAPPLNSDVFNGVRPTLKNPWKHPESFPPSDIDPRLPTYTVNYTPEVLAVEELHEETYNLASPGCEDEIQSKPLSARGSFVKMVSSKIPTPSKPKKVVQKERFNHPQLRHCPLAWLPELQPPGCKTSIPKPLFTKKNYLPDKMEAACDCNVMTETKSLDGDAVPEKASAKSRLDESRSVSPVPQLVIPVISRSSSSGENMQNPISNLSVFHLNPSASKSVINDMLEAPSHFTETKNCLSVPDTHSLEVNTAESKLSASQVHSSGSNTYPSDTSASNTHFSGPSSPDDVTSTSCIKFSSLPCNTSKGGQVLNERSENSAQKMNIDKSNNAHTDEDEPFNMPFSKAFITFVNPEYTNSPYEFPKEKANSTLKTTEAERLELYEKAKIHSTQLLYPDLVQDQATSRMFSKKMIDVYQSYEPYTRVRYVSKLSSKRDGPKVHWLPPLDRNIAERHVRRLRDNLPAPGQSLVRTYLELQTTQTNLTAVTIKEDEAFRLVDDQKNKIFNVTALNDKPVLPKYRYERTAIAQQFSKQKDNLHEREKEIDSRTPEHDAGQNIFEEYMGRTDDYFSKYYNGSIMVPEVKKNAGPKSSQFPEKSKGRSKYAERMDQITTKANQNVPKQPSENKTSTTEETVSDQELRRSAKPNEIRFPQYRTNVESIYKGKKTLQLLGLPRKSRPQVHESPKYVPYAPGQSSMMKAIKDKRTDQPEKVLRSVTGQPIKLVVHFEELDTSGTSMLSQRPKSDESDLKKESKPASHVASTDTQPDSDEGLIRKSKDELPAPQSKIVSGFPINLESSAPSKDGGFIHPDQDYNSAPASRKAGDSVVFQKEHAALLAEKLDSALNSLGPCPGAGSDEQVINQGSNLAESIQVPQSLLGESTGTEVERRKKSKKDAGWGVCLPKFKGQRPVYVPLSEIRQHLKPQIKSEENETVPEAIPVVLQPPIWTILDNMERAQVANLQKGKLQGYKGSPTITRRPRGMFYGRPLPQHFFRNVPDMCLNAPLHRKPPLLRHPHLGFHIKQPMRNSDSQVQEILMGMPEPIIFKKPRRRIKYRPVLPKPWRPKCINWSKILRRQGPFANYFGKVKDDDAFDYEFLHQPLITYEPWARNRIKNHTEEILVKCPRETTYSYIYSCKNFKNKTVKEKTDMICPKELLEGPEVNYPEACGSLPCRYKANNKCIAKGRKPPVRCAPPKSSFYTNFALNLAQGPPKHVNIKSCYTRPEDSKTNPNHPSKGKDQAAGTDVITEGDRNLFIGSNCGEWRSAIINSCIKRWLDGARKGREESGLEYLEECMKRSLPDFPNECEAFLGWKRVKERWNKENAEELQVQCEQAVRMGTTGKLRPKQKLTKNVSGKKANVLSKRILSKVTEDPEEESKDESELEVVAEKSRDLDKDGDTRRAHEEDASKGVSGKRSGYSNKTSNMNTN